MAKVLVRWCDTGLAGIFHWQELSTYKHFVKEEGALAKTQSVLLISEGDDYTVPKSGVYTGAVLCLKTYWKAKYFKALAEGPAGQHMLPKYWEAWHINSCGCGQVNDILPHL